LASRLPSQLTVRLADATAAGPEIRRLIGAQGWVVETSRRVQTDLELLCFPGRGRFSPRTDCRVIACFDESAFKQSESLTAHVILSPTGQLGNSEQIKLHLGDVEGLWAALEGRTLAPRRLAA
jgi:hypothetical protein